MIFLKFPIAVLRSFLLTTVFLGGVLSSVGASADLLLESRYSVPLTAEQEIKFGKFNSFALYNYRIDQTNVGAEKMLFDLPPNLTAGKSLSLEFTVVSKVDKTRILEGDNGIAECVGPWTAMSCQFKFKNLEYDVKDSGPFLEKKYGITAQAQGLSEIATVFGNDPIGVGVVQPADPSNLAYRQGNGIWKVKWSQDAGKSLDKSLGKTTKFTFEIDGSTGTYFSPGSYTNVRGALSQISYQGSVLTAIWESSTGKKGWLKISLAADKFLGEWGLQNSTQVIENMSGKR